MSFWVNTAIVSWPWFLQGERILKLAEMCRKLETEEEKVLPLYATSLTSEEQEDISAAVLEPPTEKLAGVRGHTFLWDSLLFKVAQNYPYVKCRFSMNASPTGCGTFT